MAKQVQWRRGTTAQHNTFTGAVGEVTVDTDRKVAVVHDGSTAGGFPLQHAGTATSTQLNDASATINTTAKFAGKQVFNTSDNRPVYATGATTGSVWVYSDGTTAHSPS